MKKTAYLMELWSENTRCDGNVLFETESALNNNLYILSPSHDVDELVLSE
jgi:hypothetical protein